MPKLVVLTLLLFWSSPSFAADYDVDLGLVLDLEDIRPLVDGCSDIGDLEDHRDALDSASDFEDLRSFLEELGYVSFRDCPSGVEGSGIERVD